MTYQFPPDVDQAVKERMASGLYSSEDDLLRDALRALRWRDQEVAAVQEGVDDMNAGRVTSLREFDRTYRERNDIPQDA